MTIKMYQSYWRSVGTALLVGILLSSVACNSLQAAASTDLGRQLLTAACEGDLDEVKRLVDTGADINAASIYGETPLYIAAYFGYLPMVRYLVGQGADINAANKDGEAPLQGAVHWDHLDVVRYLVEHGDKVNVANKGGEAPAQGTVHWGHQEIVEYLNKVVLRQEEMEALNRIDGEWRLRNHSTLPPAYRDAMTTLVILAKGV